MFTGRSNMTLVHSVLLILLFMQSKYLIKNKDVNIHKSEALKRKDKRTLNMLSIRTE